MPNTGRSRRYESPRHLLAPLGLPADSVGHLPHVSITPPRSHTRELETSSTSGPSSLRERTEPGVPGRATRTPRVAQQPAGSPHVIRGHAPIREPRPDELGIHARA